MNKIRVKLGLVSIGFSIAWLLIVGVLSFTIQALKLPEWVNIIIFFFPTYGAIFTIINLFMNRSIPEVSERKKRHRQTVAVLFSFLVIVIGATTSITVAIVGRRYGINPNDALWVALLIIFTANFAVLFGIGRWASSNGYSSQSTIVSQTEVRSKTTNIP
jgi:hypothetical protein